MKVAFTIILIIPILALAFFLWLLLEAIKEYDLRPRSWWEIIGIFFMLVGVIGLLIFGLYKIWI